MASPCAAAGCAKAARSRCGSCKQVWYCSKPCQLSDWHAGHKTRCLAPAAASESAAPAGAASAARASGGAASAMPSDELVQETLRRAREAKANGSYVDDALLEAALQRTRRQSERAATRAEQAADEAAQADFARLVVATAARQHLHLVHDAAAGTLGLDAQRHPQQGCPQRRPVLVAPVFAQYAAQKQPQFQSRVVVTLIDILAVHAQPLPPYAAVADALSPRVHDEAYFALIDLHQILHNLAAAFVPRVELGAGMCACLVYHVGNVEVTVTHDHLAAWGAEFDSVLAPVLARHRAAPVLWAELRGYDGAYMARRKDGTDAALLLLPDELARLPVLGRPVAIAPHRDVLLVTGSEDGDGLECVLQTVTLQLGMLERPCTQLLVLPHDTATSWEPFRPPAEFAPARAMSDALAATYVSKLYDEQKHLLDAINAADPNFIRDSLVVATHVLSHDKATGKTLAYCVWVKDVECLLPVSDIILFGTPDTFPYAVVGEAAWADVRELLGDAVMEPTDSVPPRFRVRADAFPSDAQLARLCPRFRSASVASTDPPAQP